MTRNSKIARLPQAVRELINQWLANGEPGKALSTWLNGLPEVMAVLDRDFGGRSITVQNLPEWRQGGFVDWQRHQESLEIAPNPTESDRIRPNPTESNRIQPNPTAKKRASNRTGGAVKMANADIPLRQTARYLCIANPCATATGWQAVLRMQAMEETSLLAQNTPALRWAEPPCQVVLRERYWARRLRSQGGRTY